MITWETLRQLETKELSLIEGPSWVDWSLLIDLAMAKISDIAKSREYTQSINNQSILDIFRVKRYDEVAIDAIFLFYIINDIAYNAWA